MKKLALYGAGSLGYWMLELYVGGGLALARYDEVLFAGDACVPAPAGVPVADFAGLLREAAAHEVSATVCIGSPGSRHEVAARLEGAGIGLATLVSVEARVSRRARVGAGCIVNGFSSIEPDVELGANTLALGASVSRGSVVGRGCVLDSRCVLSRGCRVGERALIGVGPPWGKASSWARAPSWRRAPWRSTTCPRARSWRATLRRLFAAGRRR